MKFSVKDLCSKCEHIRRKMQICSHLRKKFSTKTLIFVLVQSNYTKVVVSKDFNCWRILHQDIVVLIRKCILVLLHFDPLPFLFLCVQSEGKAPPFNHDVHFWLGKATSQVKLEIFSISA